MMQDEPASDEPASDPDPLQQAVTALVDRVRELDGETDGIRELVQRNTQQVTEILSRFATEIQQQLSQIELTQGPQGVDGRPGGQQCRHPDGRDFGWHHDLWIYGGSAQQNLSEQFHHSSSGWAAVSSCSVAYGDIRPPDASAVRKTD